LTERNGISPQILTIDNIKPFFPVYGFSNLFFEIENYPIGEKNLYAAYRYMNIRQEYSKSTPSGLSVYSPVVSPKLAIEP
jgi:hypothetical protein